MARNKPLGEYIGEKFGYWEVIGIGEEKRDSRGYIEKMLKCKCTCGQCNEMIRDIRLSSLKAGRSNGCEHKKKENTLGYSEDLTGQRFGNLVVENFAYSENSHSHWNCKCDCGNYRIVDVTYLNTGKMTKCLECTKKERVKEYNKNKKVKANNKIAKDILHKQRYLNKFILDGEFGIGYTRKGQEFYFDLEDYDLIKDYCWHLNSSGYPVACIRDGSGKEVFLHNLVMNTEPCKVDHINRVRHDCRKENLRFMNRSQNASNINLRKDNTSGVIGVSWNKKLDKWEVLIQYERKAYYLGVYSNKEEAIIVRLKAEKELMGEFSPQQHLFEEYGVE